MALNQLVDSRDVRFVLFEMLELEKLNRYPQYADFDRDIYEDALELAEKIAVNYFYPSNSEGDKEGGAQFNPETNEVRVPDSIKAAARAYLDAGFMTLTLPAEDGGMGMPGIMRTACLEYFQAGNTACEMYLGGTLGAALLIATFGTDEQKKLYLPKMFAGEWGGDMCLTEPDAGSDVGALKSKAVKQADGTYLITGQKVFISSGEHDMVENLIHPVLARIEGDPPGTKGISIFIVPKYLVNQDGSLGERNDVVCSGIEHKMGLKNSPTAALNFGDNGKCIGYLLGEERQGMKIMFKLMNEARIATGLQAQGQSSAAYMHAVTYARNRIQSRHITQSANPEATGVPIIQHPDVQRMLIWMKSYVEGMRMLSSYLSYCVDISQVGEEDEAKKAHGIVELFTPIVKAGISDVSWLVTSEAIQVYGGYGVCSDYPVEQYARDTKVFSIYEGTNGIQSLDLTFRKILMNPDQFNLKAWREKVEEIMAKVKGVVDEKYIALVERGLAKFDEIINFLQEQMAAGNFLVITLHATPLQQCMFMLVLAWLHLWSLSITMPKLKELVGDAKGEDRKKIIEENLEAAYYSGRVLSSQFFIGSEFPTYFGKVECILNNELAAIKTSSATFTGALEE